jgi:2-amino-4-hydroxy-6-hydroxymethyldihydropteridine diphosphokinase
MAEVFIGLGSNLGDRARNLAEARAALADGILKLIALSSVYETEPWGPVLQGRYLNQVLRGETRLQPRALIAAFHRIEKSLGRERTKEVRYGPRTIDLDLLTYDDLKLAEPGLEIPHPRLLERAFVLAPLAEIAPDLMIKGTKVRDALAKLGSAGVVRLA